MKARSLSLSPTPWLVGAGLVLVLVGCSSSSSSSTSVTHPTMIAVTPESFLGEVPCTEGPGLKRYVATLFDTTEGSGGASSDTGTTVLPGNDFQLPSSPPTPCLAGVGFGLVVPGRHYDVVIEGYDTDDLAPRAVGSREMVSPAPTKATPVTPLATPRWLARCADATAVQNVVVQAQRCTRFEPASSDAKGSVRIALGSLLNGLECGSEAGKVDHFEVSLRVGDGAEQLQEVPCSEDAEALFADLPARTRVEARVTAKSADDGAFDVAGASCNAFTRPEASIDAACTALSQVGTLRIDLTRALGAVELSCDAAVLTSVTLKLPGAEALVRLVPPDCRQPFDQGFGPGPAVVELTATAASGEVLGLTCHADVAPGAITLAECEPIPAAE